MRQDFQNKMRFLKITLSFVLICIMAISAAPGRVRSYSLCGTSWLEQKCLECRSEQCIKWTLQRCNQCNSNSGNNNHGDNNGSTNSGSTNSGSTNSGNTSSNNSNTVIQFDLGGGNIDIP